MGCNQNAGHIARDTVNSGLADFITLNEYRAMARQAAGDDEHTATANPRPPIHQDRLNHH